MKSNNLPELDIVKASNDFDFLKKIAVESGYHHVKLDETLDTSPHMSLGMILRFLLVMPFSSLYMQNANNRSVNIYLCH